MIARTVNDESLRAAARVLVPGPFSWERLSGSLLIETLSDCLPHAERRASYLLLAVLQRRIPTEAAVVAFTRQWHIDGLGDPLTAEYRRHGLRQENTRLAILSGVIVDVTDTGRSRFTTGIQRVARETVTRWSRHGSLSLVAWDLTGRHLVPLTSDETSRVLLHDPALVDVAPVEPEGTVVIPFESTFLLPEITVNGARTQGIRSVVSFGASRSVAIGFDCIPVTTAETSGPGMPGAFSKYLAMLALFDVIAPISTAAATEYAGWSHMLLGAGLVPPSVQTVTLPAQVGSVTDDVVASTREQLGLTDQPVVLSVGSHEPRKNHLNLLVAAELNWRAGREFSLVLVGGNAWGDGEFRRLVTTLRRKGRSVTLLSGVDDSVIWSLYRLARVTVFCSVNEGFGLPVVESIVSGVPVITSDFGSMRELGEGHGGVVVDPHDPQAMGSALGRLLVDDGLHASLVAETASLPRPTWDDYASSLWAHVR